MPICHFKHGPPAKSQKWRCWIGKKDLWCYRWWFHNVSYMSLIISRFGTCSIFFQFPKNDVIHLLQPRPLLPAPPGWMRHGPSYSGPLTAMPKSGHGTPTGRRLRNRSESDLRGKLGGALDGPWIQDRPDRPNGYYFSDDMYHVVDFCWFLLIPMSLKTPHFLGGGHPLSFRKYWDGRGIREPKLRDAVISEWGPAWISFCCGYGA